MIRFVTSLLLGLTILTAPVYAQSGPLRLELDQGIIEPLPFAVPNFVPDGPAAAQYANDITRVVAADLTGTGLFREISADAFISRVSSFDSPVQFADWKAINAEALVTGAVNVSGNRLTVRFRVWDVFSGQLHPHKSDPPLHCCG